MRFPSFAWDGMPSLRIPLKRVLRKYQPFTPQSPATYSIGLSYASKNSPPFIPPYAEAPRYGFANLRDANGFIPKVTAFVEDCLSRQAGRGVLNETAVGGWDDKISVETRRWGAGEDFFCIADREWTAEDYAIPSIERRLDLAISDGVGGWADTVDPSLFPQMLMYRYHQTATNTKVSRVIDLLQKAFNRVSEDAEVPAGGATACVIRLLGDGTLDGLNIGDSGCVILRDGKTVFATVADTHYFNCPKQLAKIPDQNLSSALKAGSDLWQQGPIFSAELMPGDVIILYTDGLSDNVPAEHIPLLHSQVATLLSHSSNSHLTPDERDAEMARLFADVLVGYGRMGMARTGRESGWKTPFELAAREAGYDYKGGKVDDITVMTAVVGQQEAENSSKI